MTRTGSTGLGPVFLVRIAGLPAAAVERLEDAALARRTGELLALDEALDDARAALVEALYARISGAPPARRRRLLALKRDAYNGRPLDRHRRHPGWPALRAELPAAGAVAELEDRLAAGRAAHAETYDAARERLFETLLEIAGRGVWRRGLALASPTLAAALGRGRAAIAALAPRKRRKLEHSLLRFATRTAAKLSPYSTLTRTGLGIVGGGAGGLALLGSAWEARSSVAFRRYLFDQIVAVLARCPPFRASLPIARNSTAEVKRDGRLRLLRPADWIVDRETRTLRYRPPSLVRLDAGGALLETLDRALAADAPSYAELLAALERDLGLARSALEPAIERWIELGFLVVQTPWPSRVAHLETALLDHCRRLGDALPAPLVAALERAVTAQTAFPSDPRPETLTRRLDAALDELWRAVRAFAGLDPGVGLYRPRAGDVYEDVWLRPAGGDRIGAVAELPRAAAERLAHSLAPWTRIAYLRGYRLDALHTFDAALRRRWPGRREVPLLDVFAETRPLWRDLSRFTAEPGGAGAGWTDVWNPLGLETVERLGRLRAKLWHDVAELFSDGDGRVASAALDRLLAAVPDVYDPLAGVCVQIQPLDGDGKAWVVNRLFEGTGRYGSRFTLQMAPEERRLYRETVAALARGGELLDLVWSRGDGLNVHAPQTPFVLDVPGETPGPRSAHGERRVSARDLRVRIGEAGALPELRDADGRRLLPVHLGGAALRFLPAWIRFLALWGPGEIQHLEPPVRWREEDGVATRPRASLDDLVLLRRRWRFPAAELATRVAGREPADAHLELQRFRREKRLPRRVFAIERVRHPGGQEMWKPQYLDLGSALALGLLEGALAGARELVFEEMLPTPDRFPADREGERWATELQLELPLPETGDPGLDRPDR